MGMLVMWLIINWGSGAFCVRCSPPDPNSQRKLSAEVRRRRRALDMEEPPLKAAGIAAKSNALLRKNLVIQKHKLRSNLQILLWPVIICAILSFTQKLLRLTGSDTRQEMCKHDMNYLDENCPHLNPVKMPALFQIPAPMKWATRGKNKSDPNFYPDLPRVTCRAKGTCPVSLLLTGANRSLAESLGKFFYGSETFKVGASAKPNALEIASMLILGTSTIPPTSYLMEPAFIDLSNSPLYVVQQRCKRGFTLMVGLKVDGMDFDKDVECVKGLQLWREDSRDIIRELAMGEIIEFLGAYDFSNTNPSNFNVTIWFNYSDQLPSATSKREGFRILRATNVASNSFLQFFKGSKVQMLLEFVKEMPNAYAVPASGNTIVMTVETITIVGVIQSLIPFLLTDIIYEKQKNLRMIMKMHGLGDTPYWIITYGYLLTVSTVYILVLILYGSFLGLEIFLVNDYSFQAVFYFICINVQIAFMLLFSTFFSDFKTASVSANIFVVGMTIVQILLQVLLNSGQMNQSHLKYIKFFPNLAIHGGIYILGEYVNEVNTKGTPRTSWKDIMTGLTTPSSGTAFVQGLDIREDMDIVYTRMGVCPQHDLLWEVLTGREHLYFYGRLKNLEGDALNQAVDESLKSVNLMEKGDTKAGQYSGGMKRRLSVAISLIGNPKAVYLDEPSTGLDPASKKSLWTTVQHAKKDKAIILTTHSMEEAEFLCDRVGIFVDGRLQCIGNPKELRAQYGGYFLLTITAPSENSEKVESLVQSLSPTATKIYHISGTQKFHLTKAEVRLADIFKTVENAMSTLKIQDWGLADATLEDVFLKVAQGAESIS